MKLDFTKPLYVLAPLAGFTDLPFRSVVKKFGVDLTISEMISSNALVHNSKKTYRMLEKSPIEDPYAIQIAGSDPQEIGNALSEIDAFKMKLKMIPNRGVKVYPEGLKETYCTDHWRCRFISKDSDASSKSYNKIPFERVLSLMSTIQQGGFDIIKTENLYEFDGKRAFSLGQGE